MYREYHKWYSTHLQKEIELLSFGQGGTPVLFFPTRAARFYDYENWGVIEAMREKINQGQLQVFCVDSVDGESFYCFWCDPGEKILRHLQYEQYILHEVVPLVRQKNDSDDLIAAGCSLGAFHAINLAFRHPHLFRKVVGMSGRYDLTRQLDHYQDLFNGYWDENIYYNSPNQFLPNLYDGKLLQTMKQMEIILAVGRDDPFYESTRQLSEILWHKDIGNAFYIWDGTAHKAHYWRQMVQHYL
ncbi:alpha/beta hydrolase-fold protein [Paraflavisolibacter sp. H34]|uniref:esterase family protein n=1 Tax=Huijunlia imazamoxiresistens TaxID=3127457 RepID=UPI00301830D8